MRSHEDKPSSYTYSYKETEMDLYNNNIGRERSDFFTDGYSSVEQSILDAVNSGALRYLNNFAPDGRATSASQLIPTNQ
ncbi:MAG: hypothetical protein AB2L24_00895 [Mangrovibacterium sp.]